MEGVSKETWMQRVQRIFAASAENVDPKYSNSKSFVVRVDDAQFKADKEMLDEIHLMLRHLVEKISQ